MNKPEPLSDDEFRSIVEPLYSYGGISDDDLNLSRPVYKAIIAARDAQWEEMLSKQKPVAWMQYVDKYGDYEFNMHREDCRQGREAIPLYAAPVMAEKQEPVGVVEWKGYPDGICGVAWKTVVPSGTKLYAAPVGQAAELERLRTVLRNLVVSLKGKYIVSKNTLEAIDAARAALEQK